MSNRRLKIKLLFLNRVNAFYAKFLARSGFDVFVTAGTNRNRRLNGIFNPMMLFHKSFW